MVTGPMLLRPVDFRVFLAVFIGLLVPLDRTGLCFDGSVLLTGVPLFRHRQQGGSNQLTVLRL